MDLLIRAFFWLFFGFLALYKINHYLWINAKVYFHLRLRPLEYRGQIWPLVNIGHIPNDLGKPQYEEAFRHPEKKNKFDKSDIRREGRQMIENKANLIFVSHISSGFTKCSNNSRKPMPNGYMKCGILVLHNKTKER